MGKHSLSADFIIELNNGYYISGGCDNKLILYNEQFVEKKTISDLNDWAFKIGEKMGSEKLDYIKLMCATNKELDILNLDLNKGSLKTNLTQYQIPQKKCANFIEMKENNIIISGKGGASYYIDLFNSGNQLAEHKITEKTYRGGIRTNDKSAVLTSNSIIGKEGEDNLILYNTKKKSSYQINKHSFTFTNNNCAIMEDTKNKYKILLCACKSYENEKNSKNGILLVNPQTGDNKNVNDPFYEIDYFEVYCFCPILLIENKNKNYEKINEKYRKNIIIEDTDYFLVGGYDIEKREGQIKLFKILYGNKAWETKIKFIQNIEIDDDNFEEFDQPITCITQSKITGNILITSYNGYVYLFTQPNLQYYLENEKQNK
jgi:hypothetical protein